MNILVIAMTAVGGYFIGKNHNKISAIICSMWLKTQPQNKQDTVSQPIYDALAKEEFTQKNDYFSGIYEAFFEVATGTSSKANEVIAEWNTRISSLTDCPNIQKLWLALFENHTFFLSEQQKKNTNVFLNFIFSTGIKRDNRQILDSDEKTKLQYYNLNGEEITTGNTMKIMLPCWTFGNKILEKGILTLL